MSNLPARVLHLKPWQLEPDNDQYTHRFKVRSETSNNMYTVAQHKKKRHWTCNCLGWIRHRVCKHLGANQLPFHEQPFEIAGVKVDA